MSEMRCDSEIKIVILPISQLTPYERNAKKHKEPDVTAIAESIKEFGFNDPIAVWSDRNIIVEGHGRLMAAKKLGMTEVPCFRLDFLTDAQRRAYALAHNKTAELSEWDDERLSFELESLENDDFDMSRFGFNWELSDGDRDFNSEEIDVAAFSDEAFEYECDVCGFKFNA